MGWDMLSDVLNEVGNMLKDMLNKLGEMLMIAQYWGGSIFNWMWQMVRRRGKAHFLCDTILGGIA